MRAVPLGADDGHIRRHHAVAGKSKRMLNPAPENISVDATAIKQLFHVVFDNIVGGSGYQSLEEFSVGEFIAAKTASS
jgi:hypothetical protein